MKKTIRAWMRRKIGVVCAFFVGRRGEMYVDKTIGIIIAVVIGALMLTFLYTLFNENVLPAMADKIQQMFG